MTNRTSGTASQVSERDLHQTVSPRDAGRTTGERLRALEAECAHLNERLLEMQSEQQHLLERYVGLEEQNSTLTTLYVACQRLHSSLDREDVLLTVREVIANLVGCEEYVLFSLGPDGWLRRVDSLGVDPEAYERVLPGNGLIGRAVETGEVYLSGQSDPSAAIRIDKNLTACIPLKRNGVVTGALALFHFLPQKFELQELDRELFWLIESHLAQALFCADLCQTVGEKNGAIA